jgi:glutathione peroxidase
MSTESFYRLKTKTLDGREFDLSQFEGKVTLVVNVASRCGSTPQYAGLEKLHREFAERGFSVLGFPSNDFGSQEPGTPEQIATFCQQSYDVSFPLFEKVITKPGPAQSSVYGFLGTSGELPSWNFAKYLVGKDGRVLEFFATGVAPESDTLRSAILAALE